MHIWSVRCRPGNTRGWRPHLGATINHPRRERIYVIHSCVCVWCRRELRWGVAEWENPNSKQWSFIPSRTHMVKWISSKMWMKAVNPPKGWSMSAWPSGCGPGGCYWKAAHAQDEEEEEAREPGHVENRSHGQRKTISYKPRARPEHVKIINEDARAPACPLRAIPILTTNHLLCSGERTCILLRGVQLHGCTSWCRAPRATHRGRKWH